MRDRPKKIVCNNREKGDYSDSGNGNLCFIRQGFHRRQEQNASSRFKNVSTDQVQVPSICSLTALENPSLESTADWLAGVSSDLLAAGHNDWHTVHLVRLMSHPRLMVQHLAVRIEFKVA